MTVRPKKKPAVKKSVVKKVSVEPEFPKEVYAYFVTVSYGYGSRPTTRQELRVVTDVRKAPSGKTVAIFKQSSLGEVSRKVDFTLRKVVR